VGTLPVKKNYLPKKPPGNYFSVNDIVFVGFQEPDVLVCTMEFLVVKIVESFLIT
jgi:hypothetical protein